MQKNSLFAHRAKSPNRTILIVTTILNEVLKSQKEIKLNILITEIQKKFSGIRQKDIMLALNFLFIFDRIIYDSKYDSIKVVQR